MCAFIYSKGSLHSFDVFIIFMYEMWVWLCQLIVYDGIEHARNTFRCSTDYTDRKRHAQTPFFWNNPFTISGTIFSTIHTWDFTKSWLNFNYLSIVEIVRCQLWKFYDKITNILCLFFCHAPSLFLYIFFRFIIATNVRCYLEIHAWNQMHKHLN